MRRLLSTRVRAFVLSLLLPAGMAVLWQAAVDEAFHARFSATGRRYRYVLKPGKRFSDYGIEQQAEIVAHAFMLRRGWKPGSGADPAALEAVLATAPFA